MNHQQGVIPSIVVSGFVSSGKATFCQSLVDSYPSKSFFFIYDTDVLPKSLLSSRNAVVLRDNVAIKLGNSICCTLEDSNIETFILKTQFDYGVFMNNSFESTFLAELLSCIDDGSLGVLANRINLVNMVCLVNGTTIIHDLKSSESLKDKFKDLFPEEHNTQQQALDEDDCCNDDICLMELRKKNSGQHVVFEDVKVAEKSDSCCKDGKCTKEQQKESDDCCKDGKCTKEQQDDCCKDGKCSNNNNAGKRQCCQSQSEECPLEKKSDKLIASVLYEQLTCGITILVNRTDKISAAESEFINKMIRLINQSATIINIGADNKVALNQIFTHPSPLVKDFESLNTSLEGVHLLNFYQRVPFHPQRLYKFIFGSDQNLNLESFKGTLFVNGALWLAYDMSKSYDFEVNSKFLSFNPGQPYYSTLDENEWPQDSKVIESIKREIGLFKYQDRKNDISIVGIDSNGFDAKTFSEKLAQCLLTTEELELGPNGWKEFENPLQPLLESMNRDHERDEEDCYRGEDGNCGCEH